MPWLAEFGCAITGALNVLLMLLLIGLLVAGVAIWWRKEFGGNG